jgi:glycosyltransferase involved in cell wall biosynthesis
VTTGSTKARLPRGATWLPRGVDAGDTASARRILLLTTTYPPRTEVGAARWEGFTPYLASAGWGLDAVIEQPPDTEHADWGRLARLPADVRVVAITPGNPWWHEAIKRARAALRPRRGERPEVVYEVEAYVEGGAAAARPGLRHVFNAAVHSSRSLEGTSDLAHAAEAIVDGRHRVVVSSGPPHYVHIAASRVAARHRLPHIVDLRDPWGSAEPLGLLARLLPDQRLRRFERRTLERAALILTNTAAAERALAERFPMLRDRIRNMPNGSDVEPVSAESRPRPTRFQIAHSGSLYLDRDPRPFLRAVGRVRAKLALGPDELRVVFMGNQARIAGRSLTELAAEAGLAGMFEERPSGTRDEARQLLRESSMAVAFQGETRTQVPAKVFEYVAFPVWLLALVGAESATADLLADSDAIVLDIDDEAGTERAIERCVRRFRAGESARPVGWDGRFSRARQAERLIAELQQLESRTMRRVPTG